MNDKTVEMAITVSMFSISPTHGAYITIDSITHIIAFRKLGPYSTLLHYNNMKLKEISCYKGDSGNYFKDFSNTTIT